MKNEFKGVEIMNNTLSGFHVWGKDENGALILNTEKMYNWHIPKQLRIDEIKKGDIVRVWAKGKVMPILVMNVFREDFEDTGKSYKKVIKVIDRVKEKI